MRTEDFWAYVDDAITHLDTRSYYQILGVPENADADTIGDAFYSLARRLHPDRHIRESAARQSMLTRLYARMNEAHKVLTKAETRRAYDRVLARGQNRLTKDQQAAESKRTRPMDPRTPKARAMYHKGRELMAKGDVRGARAQWQLAAQFEPDSLVLKQALSGLAGVSSDQPRTAATPAPKREPQREPFASTLAGLAPPPGPTPAPETKPAPAPSAASRTERISSVSISSGDGETLGRQALAEGRIDEACSYLEKALLAQPRDRALRAMWYAALSKQAQANGKAKTAALHRQTALAFDPTCPGVR